MKRGRPKEKGNKIKFSIILPEANVKLLRKAKDQGKVISISEAIRKGLELYLKKLNIS